MSMTAPDFPDAFLSPEDFERWSAAARQILDGIASEKGLDVEAIRQEARREIELWEASRKR